MMGVGSGPVTVPRVAGVGVGDGVADGAAGLSTPPVGPVMAATAAGSPVVIGSRVRAMWLPVQAVVITAKSVRPNASRIRSDRYPMVDPVPGYPWDATSAPTRTSTRSLWARADT